MYDIYIYIYYISYIYIYIGNTHIYIYIYIYIYTSIRIKYSLFYQVGQLCSVADQRRAYCQLRRFNSLQRIFNKFSITCLTWLCGLTTRWRVNLNGILSTTQIFYFVYNNIQSVIVLIRIIVRSFAQQGQRFNNKCRLYKWNKKTILCVRERCLKFVLCRWPHYKGQMIKWFNFLRLNCVLCTSVSDQEKEMILMVSTTLRNRLCLRQEGFPMFYQL